MQLYMGSIDATDDATSHDWVASMPPHPLYKEWMDRRRIRTGLHSEPTSRTYDLVNYYYLSFKYKCLSLVILVVSGG